jgi:hypothetical protein
MMLRQGRALDCLAMQELHVAQNDISSDGVTALVNGLLAQHSHHRAFHDGRETAVLTLHL